MVLDYAKKLKKALSELGNSSYHQFSRDGSWLAIDLLNEKYCHQLSEPFDLYNWINHNQNDEAAYFLNEAYSNALSHSQCLNIQLWLGENGFVLGLEQEGQFNPWQIDRLGVKDNQGAGFAFFRGCRSKVFFDHPEKARIIYLQFLFKVQELRLN
ncbi:MAG TPA: hypothetical protein VJH68_03470 [Candidatus Nanoarchaeia archaeon]|nr:hypothetical protein [Candidatus Nanoarchaeia archaeon]